MNPEMIQQCDNYLDSRTGCYDYRKVRYTAAWLKMRDTLGLEDSDTLYDIGAGWTELDYCLRSTGDWRGRYIPIDGGIDGTDLEEWMPPRTAEWFVALELIEHLERPEPLLRLMKTFAKKGVILSTPNPYTTDVLGMDETHKTVIWPQYLQNSGFEVEARSFYGKPNDSLFAWWIKHE